MHRTLPNHCGYAYVCAGDRDATGVWTAKFAYSQEDSDTASPTMVLKFSMSGSEPTATVPFPETVKDACKDMSARSTKWYQARQPLIPDLKNVHVPTLPCPFPWMPGFAFAAMRPIASEHQDVFRRALDVAAARRRWVLAERMRDDADASVLVVEALAAIPNCFVYNEDCRIDRRTGLPTADEAFYADERTIGNGDCEDAAHALVNAAYSWRNGSWSDPFVARGQRLLKRYVVAEQLSGVNMDGAGADVDRYKADPGNPDCHIFAHAFVLFLPAAWVAQALQLGGSGARLADGVDTTAEETLAADGIALFAARALAPLEASSWGGDDEYARVEVVQRIGDNYYKVVSSCMLIDASVVCRDGSPVYELGYTTGPAYGARFVDVVNQSPGVGLVPVLASVSRREVAIIEHCATYFHPIAPFEADDKHKPDLSKMRQALGAVEVFQPPQELSKREVFIQSSDALSDQFLEHLAKRVKTFKRAVYMLDYMAKGVFAVHLYLYS
jgi:hypothetical protein